MSSSSLIDARVRTPSGTPPKQASVATRIRRESIVWDLLKLWIAVGGWLSLSGWCLSLLGCLNRTGYLASLVLGVAALGGWMWKRRVYRALPFRTPWSAWRRRLRQPVAAAYFLALALAILGGLLYAPNNFDALTYRVPQALHWLDAGRWHWIATSNNHLNITAPGYGWLLAPLLALTQSDRGFFLPNLIAYAFLPGLLFSVFRRCDVPRRVAWFWMWILAAGYCYATQAGGIANDLLPAVYLLAAVALALRSRRSHSVSDAGFSMLAAALATGVKIVVLPLGLVWLVAFAPCWRILLRRPVHSAFILVVSLAVSFVPTAFLNAKFSGNWAGDLENVSRIRVSEPVYGVLGNALEIAVGNAVPPIWPAPEWSNAVFARFHETNLGHTLRQHYPRFELQWFEMVTEDGAGVGLGVVILAATALVAALILRRRSSGSLQASLGWAVSIAGFLAIAVYGVKMGSEAAPRLVAAYYPFLVLPVLLLPVHRRLTHLRWWRILAAICTASIIPSLILAPARPLFPAHGVIAKLAEGNPSSAFLRRADLVYETFANRHDNLAPLRRFLPANAKTIGFVPTGNDLETSLWRPFGTRRVVEVLQPSRSDPAVTQLAGSVIVCTPRGLSDRFHMTAEEFCAAVAGRITGEEILTLKAAIGPEKWYVIAL